MSKSSVKFLLLYSKVFGIILWITLHRKDRTSEGRIFTSGAINALAERDVYIRRRHLRDLSRIVVVASKTATAGSDVVQSGRPIFDDFFQHLWPYIGNNTANVVFQMVTRLWLIRIDQ
ncbi:hypothetical protein TNCV_4908601 [Trichonephila clavipes]|uniref:Uncharacterized protein n=1 Tax=Trichonephila clavipes TaxID=2585209 RepID=A0A8X6S0A3_TRICX|nr:hypothetical protein TNCV_4908601 [Trichonephila clavipes]